MKTTIQILTAFVVCMLWIACQPTKKNEAKPPNIIFFMVDDLGWMDTAVYGSEYYETPHIDRLAEMGMRFTRAYAANPLCSPTRASIMSGKHPGRFFLTTPAGHLPPNPNEVLLKARGAAWQKVVCPKSRTFMPLEEYTIAEALKTTGYVTAHIGKWHLGHEAYWPEKQGFDFNIGGGHHPGPPSFFSPYKISTLPDGPEHEYITDRITEEALSFIEEHRDTSFFLNFWQFAVHAPYQAPLTLSAKYAAKEDPRGQQQNPIMGGMIEKMDESLGRLLDKLEELALMDNTLIIFFSDNGGNMYDRVEGTYPTNNFPLKYGKGNIYEGGIRVPCILVWKNQIAPNSISHELIQSIDFYPTLLEMAGLEPKEQQILDGLSLLDLMKTQTPLKRKAIFSHYPHYMPAPHNLPSTAVWSDQWKLIKVYGEGENQEAAYKLYDLEKDIGESTDVAQQNPKVVAELSALIEAHLEEIGAIIPIPNPAFDPTAESRMGRQPNFPLDKYPSY